MNGQFDALVEAVRRFVDGRTLIPRNAKVVVGVSGGADSVALLSVLRELTTKDHRNWELTVAHLHHGIRDDADADADFVGELARKWGFPFVIERCDVPAESRRIGLGIEETARDLRYEFYCRIAELKGASHVALGHHADDNVETVLYRIVRGTHLRGAGGIPASRPIHDSQIMLVRPLLHCRRAEIESFCLRTGLTWRTDATNTDVRYRRNLIRHEILPLLREKLNPRVDEAILRLAAAASEAQEYLTHQANALLQSATTQVEGGPLIVDCATFARQSDVVRKVAMRLALENLGVPLRKLSGERFHELSSMFDPDGAKAVGLTGNFIARREADRIVIGPSEDTPELDEQSGTLPCPGSADLGEECSITCQILPLDSCTFDAHCSGHVPGVECIDADQIQGPLVFRPRRDGDVFRPLGSPGRQSVSDFLTNLKLPTSQRKLVRCICDDQGIVYLAPLRIDERVKVTANTQRVLRISAVGFDSYIDYV